MIRIIPLGMVLLILAGGGAWGVEPGARVSLSGGLLELFGESTDDFTLGFGGSVGLGYRLQESFALNLRWIARYQHGIGENVAYPYNSASYQGFILESLLTFNPDAETRPLALVGIGLTWLGWDYTEPWPLDGDQDFLITDDKRRATTFVLGAGAEIDIGERWELLPTVQLLLNSWSDHTYQGSIITDSSGNIQAPTDAAIMLEIGVARQL